MTGRFDEVLPRVTVGERLLERERELTDVQAQLTAAEAARTGAESQLAAAKSQLAAAEASLADARRRSEQLDGQARALRADAERHKTELQTAKQRCWTANQRNNELLRIAYAGERPTQRLSGQMELLDEDGHPAPMGHIQVFFRSKSGSTERSMFLSPELHDLLVAVRDSEDREQKQAADRFHETARAAGFGKGRCEALIRSARANRLGGDPPGD